MIYSKCRISNIKKSRILHLKLSSVLLDIIASFSFSNVKTYPYCGQIGRCASIKNKPPVCNSIATEPSQQHRIDEGSSYLC